MRFCCPLAVTSLLAITKSEVLMFTELEEINSRPEPFQYYTAEELWADNLPATPLPSDF